jgi:hypothetical protein
MVPAQISNIDYVIYHEVTRLVSCSLDELAQRLPVYSWAQVFAAVDRLSRTSRFGYALSMCSDSSPSSFLRPEKPGIVQSADRATDSSRPGQQEIRTGCPGVSMITIADRTNDDMTQGMFRQEVHHVLVKLVRGGSFKDP